MSLPIWSVAVLLVGAAVVMAWPARSSRRRRRALLCAGAPGQPAVTSHDAGPFRTASSAFLASAPSARAPARSPSAAAAVDPNGSWSTGSAVAPGGTSSSPSAAAPARPPSFRPPGRRDSRRPPEPLRIGAGEIRRLDQDGPVTAAPDGHRPDGAATAGTAARWSSLVAPLAVRPRRTLLLVGLVAAGLGGLAAGPVAGVLLGGYGVLGVRAVLRHRTARHAVGERRRRLDQLCGLAADLRAGLPVPTPDDDGDRLGSLTRAAVRLADRTGAPLAELLERVEADARALDRGLAAASAQAAGARATALLLAALPLGGIGLGYGIGADPVAVLLHTPVGAVSAVTAMGLQIGGLLWAERLGSAPDVSDR
ncbi:hypothetical protein ABZ807_09905 [Micromonospora sp. NPDC047548]|uniref:hypothetical protein n=1 Tax=Micromonospora sp. NPDC047548 TaxID=3155624 RepID=UPI0033D70F87